MLTNFFKSSIKNMKKYFVIYFGVMLSLLASCTKEEAPRPIAEKFLNAMQKRDYSEASKYGTKETVKLLKQLERIEKLNESDLTEKSGKINIVSEDIQGTVATVYFTEEGNELQQKITLKKVSPIEDTNGKKEWKVALKKEEIQLNKQPRTKILNDSLPGKIPV